MPDLIEAANAALAYLKRHREDLVGSYCILQPDETYDEATATGEEADHLNEVKILIDGLAAAVEDPFPTRIIIDVWTGHLCAEATELLDTWADRENEAIYRRTGERVRFECYKHRDGHYIRVPWEEEPGEHDEDEKDLPSSLRACVKLAREKSSCMIKFDHDADTWDGLELHYAK